jgi:hypothetical protein
MEAFCANLAKCWRNPNWRDIWVSPRTLPGGTGHQLGTYMCCVGMYYVPKPTYILGRCVHYAAWNAQIDRYTLAGTSSTVLTFQRVEVSRRARLPSFFHGQAHLSLANEPICRNESEAGSASHNGDSMILVVVPVLQDGQLVYNDPSMKCHYDIHVVMAACFKFKVGPIRRLWLLHTCNCRVLIWQYPRDIVCPTFDAAWMQNSVMIAQVCKTALDITTGSIAMNFYQYSCCYNNM